MSTFSPGTVLSFALDEYDILTIDGQTLLEVTPTGRHYYQTQTFGHQVIGPFGVTTTVTLTGQSNGSYLQSPSNQPSPVTMVDISAAQQASPTAAMLASTTTLFQLNSTPYTIYQSNGSALVAIGAGGSGVTTAAALTDISTINLPTTNAPLAAALAAAGAPAQSVSYSTTIPLDTAGNGKYMPQTTLNANSVFTVGASPIEQGNCNFSLVGNGTNIPNLTAFVNANNYTFSSTAGANNIYAAVYTYGSPLLYGQLGNISTTVPGQPTALTAGISSGTNQALSWTAPGTGGASTTYLVEYRTTTGPGSWTTFAHSASSALSITVTGLTINTSYDYRVSGVNGAGTGTASSTITAVTLALPGQPTGLTLGAASSSTQALTWTAGGGGAASTYLVEYRTTAGPGSWTAGGTPTTTSATVSGLAASTSYDYRVTGVNAAGSGTASSTATGSTSSSSIFDELWPGTAGAALPGVWTITGNPTQTGAGKATWSGGATANGYAIRNLSATSYVLTAVVKPDDHFPAITFQSDSTQTNYNYITFHSSTGMLRYVEHSGGGDFNIIDGTTVLDLTGATTYTIEVTVTTTTANVRLKTGAGAFVNEPNMHTSAGSGQIAVGRNGTNTWAGIQQVVSSDGATFGEIKAV